MFFAPATSSQTQRAGCHSSGSVVSGRAAQRRRRPLSQPEVWAESGVALLWQVSQHGQK
jgi:hypothetical protein